MSPRLSSLGRRFLHTLKPPQQPNRTPRNGVNAAFPLPEEANVPCRMALRSTWLVNLLPEAPTRSPSVVLRPWDPRGRPTPATSRDATEPIEAVGSVDGEGKGNTPVRFWDGTKNATFVASKYDYIRIQIWHLDQAQWSLTHRLGRTTWPS